MATLSSHPIGSSMHTHSSTTLHPLVVELNEAVIQDNRHFSDISLDKLPHFYIRPSQEFPPARASSPLPPNNKYEVPSKGTAELMLYHIGFVYYRKQFPLPTAHQLLGILNTPKEAIGIGLEINTVELRGSVTGVEGLEDGKVHFIVERFNSKRPTALLEVAVQYTRLSLWWKLRAAYWKRSEKVKHWFQAKKTSRTKK
jgi:hypothetical protein